MNVAKSFFISGLGTAELQVGQTMGAIRMSNGGSTLSGTITLVDNARIASGATAANTISGKITELAVRDVIHGRPVKNLDALANPQALEQFRDLPELR